MAERLGLDLEIVGKHGGSELATKLSASLDRQQKLHAKVKRGKPDACVSFLSPEAARISFGLGIPHLAESDSPHASHVCRLVVPLLDSLFTPACTKSDSWSRYGIRRSRIHQFNALDPIVWLRDHKTDSDVLKNLGLKQRDKIVTVRTEEDQAAYTNRSSDSPIRSVAKRLARKYADHKFVILARYGNNRRIERDGNIFLVNGIIDGLSLLRSSILFIGGGGTMTQEASLMGIPSIGAHRSTLPEVFSNFLIPRGLVKWRTKGVEIAKEAETILNDITRNRSSWKKKADRVTSMMKDPIPRIAGAIQELRAHS